MSKADYTMKGLFTLLSPRAFAEVAKVEIPVGWFVISHRWMPEKVGRRLLHGRWSKIKSPNGEIFRILRFSTNLEGSPSQGSGQIVLDRVGWLDLQGRAENVDIPIQLEFIQARWWQFPKLAVAHPDPTIRLSGRLGLWSVFLGALSIILAIWALWKTYNP